MQGHFKSQFYLDSLVRHSLVTRFFNRSDRIFTRYLSTYEKDAESYFSTIEKYKTISLFWLGKQINKI